MATKTASPQRTTQARRVNGSRSAELTSAQREEITRLAYQLWIDGGCQHGRDREDWLKAEAIVLSRLS